MLNDSLTKAKEAAIRHYKCLQEETLMINIDKDRNMIVIYWHTFLDGYISRARVNQIAAFLHKRVPSASIFDSIRNIY